jgi:hypothetical protein
MVGIWAGIGVLIGMQLAGSGHSQNSGGKTVYADQQAVTASSNQPPAPRKSSNHFKVEQEQPKQVAAPDTRSQTPEQILSPQTGKPTVDVFADKTAGLLQDLSQKGIQLVVSLFDSITK